MINPVTTKIVLKVSKQRKRIKVCCDFAASLDQLLLLLMRGASAGSTDRPIDCESESHRAAATTTRETRTGVGGPRPGGPLAFSFACCWLGRKRANLPLSLRNSRFSLDFGRWVSVAWLVGIVAVMIVVDLPLQLSHVWWSRATGHSFSIICKPGERSFRDRPMRRFSEKLVCSESKRDYNDIMSTLCRVCRVFCLGLMLTVRAHMTTSN